MNFLAMARALPVRWALGLKYPHEKLLSEHTLSSFGASSSPQAEVPGGSIKF